MLCEECHEQEAAYTISVVVDGGSTVRHLCADCMAHMNENIAAGNIRSLLASILSAITGQEERQEEEAAPAGLAEEPQVEQGAVCASCGMSLGRFTKTGRLGCPACYVAFREQLQPMLEQIHGRVQHAGRMPLATEDAQRDRSRREQLSRQLEQAIVQEDFETAAALRDQLRALSGKEEA